ncbi:hypothetical protein DMB66_21790 [Actinoplanes sp. ATCC 53533]|uniref:hypothetical protein n=1 Tax=Actinoplanes sp. ATCC 53533 TaxID=1288362 RepID=UPI000F77ECF3|nr:hypothetical protein [Actinoplanes sp. ATCC 53533]RSM63965.1 hypothetical protein DMB66_21790 [Actinoplanes sp. ATCC 53533]
MRWPFVRATLVLALLVCGVFGHGWHAQDAESASTVTSVPHHTASGVGSVTAGHGAFRVAVDEVSPSSTHHAARDTHQPEHHACGTAWAADKSHSLAAPALSKTASPADHGGRGEPPIATPAYWSGRSLLLLQCVSRT